MTGHPWTRGQRWVSESEPELGLGLLLGGGDGQLRIEFPAAGETRVYALESAPLRRVSFLPGDRITRRDGSETTVDAVREAAGLLCYRCGEEEIPETELADSMSFSKPEDRLFGGKIDEPQDFDLRGEALARRAEMRRSPIRGLAGARMDLIPHQLFIADEVANRPRPRVLLADEVGLGKTIEACLILHRLLLTGRASRVLILVPEPLVHQWFIELLRRFNLSFDIYDESRCEAVEYGDPEGNPFLESQWVLAATELLANDETRAAQALDAGWDLLIVDEAHHLEWSPDAPGPAYEVVRKLSECTPGLLLLTATPQQLGPEGHFARLQLLDPERYADIASYREETLHYEEVADVVEKLAAGEGLDDRVRGWIQSRPRLERAAADFSENLPGARERLIADLLDSFGLGRVMFRNTREKLGGFPSREPHFAALQKDPEPATAKTRWLAELLGKLGETEKILVIVKTKELAEEVLEAVRDATGVVGALFHEDLTLLQRDRNAAFFADDEGARLLVCSEIGSEGRNFQFARHLVLLDLPDDVDLLEQRIGRLDRIGQRGTIHIHVPYLAGSHEQLRVRWLDEGLDAFRASPHGAAEIQREVAADLAAAMDTAVTEKSTAALIARTLKVRKRISERLARGQDRLLERSSHRPERSAWLVDRIREQDARPEFEDFILRLFEQAGLYIEDLGRRRYFLLPGNLKSDAFPSLPHEGTTVTFDRQRALEREQEAFMTWDHPMIRGALDLLLGSASGNAAFAVWDSQATKEILLEAWSVIECVAPADLHVERFLPQTPVRTIVDHTQANREAEIPVIRAKLRRGDPSTLLRNEALKRKILPAMIAETRNIAAASSQALIQSALDRMHAETNAEIDRLRDLALLNDHVSPGEILALERRQAELADVITHARVRLDSVRLIWKAPPSRAGS